MALLCPFRKIKTVETKPCYNYDGEKGEITTTTEHFGACTEYACAAWDCGVCTLIENGGK
jgi:hypothetical protein